MGTLLWNMKDNLFVNKMPTQFLRVLMCAICTAANCLQRKTSRQFFVNKVIARSRRSEVPNGRYKGTDVHLFWCLLQQAKLIVLFVRYSVSGSVDQNMA